MNFLRNVVKQATEASKQGEMLRLCRLFSADSFSVVQSVTAVATEIATSPSTFLFKRPPEEEFLEKIRALVAIIEALSQREDNTSGIFLLVILYNSLIDFISGM